jgi:hypothetical protein
MAPNAVAEVVGKYDPGKKAVHGSKHTLIAAESYGCSAFIDENSEIVDGNHWSFFARCPSINCRFEAMVL